MELRALRILVEVVRWGGFTRAASVLFTTQSTVSKGLRSLEDELGMQLLERSGKLFKLTDAGRIVYNHAQSMIAKETDLMKELRDLKEFGNGGLRLGLPLSSSISHYSEWFAEFHRRYPHLTVTLVEDTYANLERLLCLGDLDLAVTILPVSAEFDFLKIRHDRLIGLVSDNHELAGGDSVPFSALAGFPLILPNEIPTLNHTILEAYRIQGLAPQVAARCSRVESIIDLVAGGFGVGLLPKALNDTSSFRGTKEIALTDPTIEVELGLFWRKGAYLSYAAKACLSVFPLPGWQ